jgi:hypothetical protein
MNIYFVLAFYAAEALLGAVFSFLLLLFRFLRLPLQNFSLNDLNFSASPTKVSICFKNFYKILALILNSNQKD